MNDRLRTMIAVIVPAFALSGFAFPAITCPAFAGEPIRLPQGQTLHTIDFDRHVVPLLSRYGCNSGSCHGSFQGRGGMRFSLFGHSRDMDFEALALRIDTEEAAESLALLKPTNEDEHEGGKRFDKGSWPYQVIRRWIDGGGNRSQDPIDMITLFAQPPQIVFSDSASQQINVQATFGDDPPVDITAFCRFNSGDDELVTVTDEGQAQTVRPGATHITIEYLGQFVTVLTSSRMPGEDESNTHDEHNAVDRFINDRLRELNLTASPPASDEVYLRRITLDTVARLPTAEEIAAFEADRSDCRRQRVIARLLAEDRHASLWATRLCDMTRCTTELMSGPDGHKLKQARMWHDWFCARFRDNVPYDQIVRGVLCGTSVGQRSYDEWVRDEVKLITDARNGFETSYDEREFLDLFWRRSRRDGTYPRKELAEITSAAFLGVQIACAQCHKHPYDHWTQTEYRGFVNVFSQINFGSSTELNSHVLAHLRERRDTEPGDRVAPLPRLAEVFNDRDMARPMVHPTTHQVVAPRALGGSDLSDAQDPRQQLMDWMVAEGRQQFARNFVNRVWAHYFGRGIVEPVDGFSAMAPPSHPRLLDHLVDEFIKTDYDVRRLEQTLLTSATYERSSSFTGNNKNDFRHFARSYVRPLMAEASIDVMHQALGVEFDASDALPSHSTAIELAADRIQFDLQQPTMPVAERMLQTFGRGPRKSACDCDRQQEPSLRQSLFRMSDPWVIKSIESGELLKSLLAQEDTSIATRIAFLRVLARRPTESEAAAAADHVVEHSDQREAWSDIVWVLVNTREFLTNR